MKKTKVFVVDDDSAYTYLVKLIIRSVDRDVEVISFADGDYAFDFISRHTGDADALPDVILLDINMPRMDGWTFMAAYAGIAGTLARRISIYILSSSISELDVSRAHDDPMIVDYISKPLEEETFRGILHALGRE